MRISPSYTIKFYRRKILALQKTIWNDFKTSLSETLSENIPEKQLKQATLPWITNVLWRKINKLNKKMTKCNRSGKSKTENIKRLKAKIQREQRSTYWKYILRA